MQELFDLAPEGDRKEAVQRAEKKIPKRNIKVKEKRNEPESFETAMIQLEEVLRKLESGQVNLEDSLEIYREAKYLAQWCYSKLASVQGELKKLGLDEDGKFILEEFPPLE